MSWFQRLAQVGQSSQFLRHNAVLFIGSITAAGLNYLYYPVLSRLMNLADFGEVQALISMFLQATIFLTAASVVITNIVTNMNSRPAERQALAELQKLLLLVALGCFLVFIILARPIQLLLHFSSFWPIVILAISILISVPVTLLNAYLRGRQRFGAFSASTIISSAAKLVFSTLFVYAGFRTSGAIGGLVVAQLIALFYTANMARRLGYFKQSFKTTSWPQLAVVAPQLKYAGLVLVVTLVVTLQFSVDILVVKRYFEPELAGLYAGTATVARIIFFLTASVAAVLLSSVQVADTSGNNRRLLVRSGFLLLGLGGVALIIFTLAPNLILRILVGAKYLSLAPLLPKLSLAIFVVSAVNLLLTYCLALRLYRVMLPAVAGALITYGLLIFHHDRLQQVIESLLLGSLLMAALVGAWAIQQVRQLRAKGARA